MSEEIDKLFQDLKEISTSSDTRKSTATNDHENDKLVFEDDMKTRSTEEVFQQIEKDLRSLPKLENNFDQLSSGTKIKTEKKVVSGREEEKKSKNDDWFSIPKPSDSMRKKLEKDLILIKHRAALDPKRHYKKDRWTVPDRFAVGTIIEDKSEFYSSRLTNKERKSNILESLMHDEQTNKYFKRKFSEIQVQKSSGKRSHYKKMKELRRKF